MKKYSAILLLLILSLGSRAEIILLRSGKTIEGEIVLQNNDIIMLRDKEGHKFQFPQNEVVEIEQVDTVYVAQQPTELVDMSKGNCALRLDMSGGALFITDRNKGGGGSIDLQIGSRKIGNQRVFVGGSIGYQAAIADRSYHFLPIMAVFSMPVMSGKHAPELGAALGYGFAINQPSKGGMVAKLDVSWRYQFAPTSALLLGVQTRFQQAQVKYLENIDGKDYYSTLGRNYVSLGLRLAMEF